MSPHPGDMPSVPEMIESISDGQARCPSLNLHMDDAYHDDEEDIDNYHISVTACMRAYRVIAERQLKDHLVTNFKRCLVSMIYGSNMIEEAGAGLTTTYELCDRAFEGDFSGIIKDDVYYTQIENDLKRMGRPHDPASIFRSANEITGHASAALYFFEMVVLGQKDLSEFIILRAHELLMVNIDAADIPWSEYAGQYRKCSVSAGLTPFMAHGMVPFAMKEMIKSLNQDIKDAYSRGEIDPIALAAKYAHIFVNIHPFLDGNGRMCRLILNTLLLKYGGIIVPFGSNQLHKDEYLGIAADASMREMSQEDLEDVPEEFKPKHYRRLASFVLKQAFRSLQTTITYLDWAGSRRSRSCPV
ncbi:Adenosine monophosphate- transferase FICD like [Fusarium albosuccineum]|uniref:Adenosine monophosphate- transferase FICD like n=1 Tax=Fusarium albosuccineum TaxID=1237068 RepID=A0A8H4P9K5_9HYPO|nr:Adenosine monophosphate- transferase FICD like [Fusarium albosuccineum]